MSNIWNDQNAFLSALKREDNSAFKALYHNAYSQVEYFILKNNGKQTDANDIFQDGIIAFLAMIRKPEFKLTAKISTLMYSICRNLWLKYLRDKRGKEVNIIDDDTKFVVLADVDESEDKAAIEAQHVQIKNALDSMGELCKKVINSFYFKKMSHKEMAAEFGYTDSYIRIRLYRCMNKLKAMVNPK